MEKKIKTSVLVLCIFFAGIQLHCSALPLFQDFNNRKSIVSSSQDKGKLLEMLQKPLPLGKQEMPTEEDKYSLFARMRLSGVGPKGQTLSQTRSNEIEEVPGTQNNALASTTTDKKGHSNLKPRERLLKPSGNKTVHESKEYQATGENLQSKSSTRNRFPLRRGKTVMTLGRLNLTTDRCNTHPFQEKIHHHGCETKFVNNSMCYGQCNSFYIPKKFVSCSSCTPSGTETILVNLKCPGQTPDFVIKKVTIVKKCSCRDCSRSVL